MRTWDLFCNVIDNYGDIGVSWRLARILARDHALAVRLWVDDLTVMQRIRPEIDPARAQQTLAGVRVCRWQADTVFPAPADVVIEAFGCQLPASYLQAMAECTPPPVWINLEYLSAETWVNVHHGLPSPHPRLPLTKHFFFPGYDAASGGLLRESDLLARCAQFQAAGVEDYWATLGLPAREPDEWRVSLFAYEASALPALLDAWATGQARVTVLVPEGRIVPQLAAWLGEPDLQAGNASQRGRLRVHVLPFSNQDDYDTLLWACDLNFVRGEDSCVRAQWAGRPMVWQAYPQDATAHFDKLDALLARYGAQMPTPLAQIVGDCWRRWNDVPGAPDIAGCWQALQAQRAAWAAHALAWQAERAGAPELGAALVEFVQKR